MASSPRPTTAKSMKRRARAAKAVAPTPASLGFAMMNADPGAAAAAMRETAFRQDAGLAAMRATPVPVGKPLGVSGVAIYSGWLVDDEKDRDLNGRAKWQTFDEILRNVAIVSTGVDHFLRLVSRPEWRCVPVDDSDEAKQVAEFCDHALADMDTPFPAIVRKAAMHVFRGFSILEWTAKRRPDGRIGIRDLEHRPQRTIERWDLDDFGRVLGVVQRAPISGQTMYLPRIKILHFVDDTFADTPEGLGIFRCVTKAARTLERLEQLEGFGYEGDLRGIPIVKAPLADLAKKQAAGEEGYSAEENEARLAPYKTLMEQHVRAMNLAVMVDSAPYLSEDGAMTPSGVAKWGFEVLQGGATSQEAVGRAIERVTTTIARRMGIEHLMMGGDASGTYGASKDKSLNFALACDAALVKMAHVVRNDLLRPLLLLNGISPDLLPKLQTDKLQWRELADVGAFLRDRATAGAPVQPGDPVDNAALRVAGFPEISEEERAAIQEQEAIQRQEAASAAADRIVGSGAPNS